VKSWIVTTISGGNMRQGREVFSTLRVSCEGATLAGIEELVRKAPGLAEENKKLRERLEFWEGGL
jgi:hypothetical protein